MLNPSTADDFTNDATVERCQRRALSMGYGGVEVVNIFAFRSTDPSVLSTLDDPVGQDNDQAIREAVVLAGMVICAWGEHGRIKGRSETVRSLLSEAGVVPHALAFNASGEPKHPLYVSYETSPVPWVKPA